MSNMKKNLRVVFGNQVPKRYVPKSLDGGHGWGVFDRKESRFLKDSEVAKAEIETLSGEMYAN